MHLAGGHPPWPPFFSIYNFNIQNNISPLFLVLTFNCESVTLFFFSLNYIVYIYIYIYIKRVLI